jgi:hypothetical protein
MVEVYKEYIKDYQTLPETANFCDLAFKKCQQELNYRKNLEKGIITPNPNPVTPVQAPKSILPQTTTSPLLIKSVSEINKSVASTAGSNQTLTSSQSTPLNPKPRTSSPTAKKQRSNLSNKSSSASSSANTQQWLNSMIMAMYGGGAGMSSMMSSSYMSEYYKMLGMSNSSSLNPMSSLLNDPTLAAALLAGTTGSPSSSPTPSTSAGTSKGFDAKMLENLMKANYGAGLQQNLVSNSLSITTTSMTSTTTSSSASKAQTSVSKKSELKSQARKSLATPTANKTDNLSTKYSSLFGTSLNLPELPKSLSITPSMPQQKPSVPKEKKKDKNMAAMNALGKFSLNPALSITTDSPKSQQISKPTTKQSTSKNPTDMHKSFEDFLKTYQNTQPGMVATNRKPAPVAVSGLGMASQVKQQQKNQKSSLQISSVHPKPSKSTPGPKMPYDFGKNIASSFMPSAMHSPTLSSSPFSHQTPPLTPSPHASPSPKTLQQKLAERKQQNQKSSIPPSSSKKNSKKYF